MIHTVKDFCIVNEAQVDFFFLQLICFLYDPTNVGNWISGSSSSSCLILELSLYLSLSARAQNKGPRGFPGVPVVKTAPCPCRGHGIVPGQGTKISRAMQQGQKINK